MKKTRKPLWIAVLVLSILIFAVGCFFLLRYLWPGDALPPRPEPVETRVTQASDAPTDAPTEAPTEKETVNTFGYELAEYEELDLSFDEMRDINPDIYAWIYIPGTAVDYPVAQSSDGDDSFYLSHNIYRQYQFSGTIYSEVQNSTDFTDPVTVLYGHNMLNGSMFASLLNFADRDFFDEHNTIFVLTADKLYTYLIYSAYTYDDRHILNSFNMADDEVFAEYLDTTLDPYTYSGNVREGVTLDTDSRILTLSTCTNGASNTRFLVQGVLVDEQPGEA